METNHRKLIEKCIAKCDAYTKEFHRFADFIGTPNIDVFEASHQLQQEYINTVELVVGDVDHWIDWYIFENSSGEGGLEAGYWGEFQSIKNIDDLIKLIDAGKESINKKGNH